jgi:uncharacterized protein (DUF1697 family)
MGTYVAFLRAVNVAGHGRLLMEDLKSGFTAAGCRRVRTYIQSGNVIFEPPNGEPAGVVEKVRKKLGLGALEMTLRKALEIEELAQRSPFPEVASDGTVKRYVVFLSDAPAVRPCLPLVVAKEALEVVAMTEREVFVLSRRKDNGSYGFPNSFLKKELQVSATSRNWSDGDGHGQTDRERRLVEDGAALIE